MADQNQALDHLYVQGYATAESFDRYSGDSGGGGFKRRTVNRGTHGAARNQELSDTFGELDGERGGVRLADDELTAQGTIIVLEGEGASYPLTSMAGLALFGDRLDAELQSNDPVQLRHRLESVRMKPGPDEAQIDPLDYGSATIQAVALPEITAAPYPSRADAVRWIQKSTPA